MTRLLAWLSFAILSGTIALAVPGAPTNLIAQVSANNVTLSWVLPGGALTAVRLEAGTGPGQTNVANLLLGVMAQLSAPNVPNGTYYVRVRAVDSTGESAPSNEVVLTVGGGGPCVPPAAPSGASSSASGANVTVSWQAVAGTGIQYILDVGTGPGLSNVGSFSIGGGASITAAVPNGSYYFRVRASNSCGTSTASNETSVTVVGGGRGSPNPAINTTTSYRHQNSLAPIDIGRLLGSNGFGGYYFDARQYIDLDGEGVQEIVVAAGLDTTGPSGPILVFKRQANGTYSDATSSYFGAGPALVHPRKAIAADFNGDGLLDLYFADHGYDHPPFPGAQNALLLSDRNSGKWAQKTIAGNPTAFHHCATAGDVDNNGTIDIFACAHAYQGVPTAPYFLLNDGTGNMSVSPDAVPASVDGLSAAELVDVDGDGYLDLTASYQPSSSLAYVTIFWGNGALPFSNTRATQIPDVAPNPLSFDVTYDIKAEDINGDGRRDLVLLRLTRQLSGYYFQILLQGAPRFFVDESLARIIGNPDTWEGNTGAWFPWIHMPDLNGDGFVDLAIGDSSAQPVARGLQWLNDRRGFFAKVP